MKKTLFALCFLLLLTGSVFSQITGVTPNLPRPVTTLPLTCAPETINSLIFLYRTDGANPPGEYLCTATNTWTRQSGGGGGTGILTLNGLTADPQTFATGTSGTNFAINSSGSTHTFNIPDASGTNRGLLTSANWTTFNNKVSLTGSETLTNKTLTSPVINVGSDATGDLLYRNSGALARIPIGSNTHVLTVVGGVPTWAAPSGGGGGTPAGSTTEVQYNDSSAFGASSQFTYTASTSQLKMISGGAAHIPFVLRAHASQSGNLMEWRNSAETVLGSITSDGRLFVTPGGYSAGAYSIMPTGQTQIGIDFLSSSNIGFFINNIRQVNIANTIVNIGSTSQYAFNSASGNNAGNDFGIGRHSAGVGKFTDAGTGIKGLVGGGTAVASAAAMPLPTGRIFHVTGTTSITSITSTNFQAGAIITLIFDGVLTFTDGGNLKLASNFTTAADSTITLGYDGTSWYEICRSIN